MGAEAAPVLEAAGLTVSFGAGRAAREVVSGVDLAIAPGECLALVGGSGSGKSVTARSLVGLAGPGSRVRATALRLAGRDVRGLTQRQWRTVRGSQVGLVLQDALVSLDPLRPIGREVDDALRLHTRLSPAQRRQHVVAALAEAGMPEPEWRASLRSGELSGGLRQRALIASALVLDPPLVIADEPTTALDVAVQQHVLDALGRMRDRGTAVLFISHDLAVVSRVADRVAVMHGGRIVETGATQRVLQSPADPYTRMLVAALPAGRPRGTRLTAAGPAGVRPGGASVASGTPADPPTGTGVTRPRPGSARETTTADSARPGAAGRGAALADPAGRGAAPADSARPGASDAPVLELVGVTRAFRIHGVSRVAVDDVSLSVFAGRTLGLVGESGSGKTTTARIALGLTAPDRGTVTVAGEIWAPLPESARRGRRRMLGAVYQDPLGSFDPRWSVGAILADALSAGATRAAKRHADRLEQLLRSVGLPPDVLSRSPRTLSGGQRQRVAIARAIAPQPAVLICDEPVSSLDVLVQAQVLDLLDELQETLGIGYLFISHDLDVIRHVSDSVAVMHAGRIVEHGEPERLFREPQHEYSRRLVAAAAG